MNRTVISAVFVELGRRLQSFGKTEETTVVIAQAVAANEWFSAEEIEMAVGAICEEMLAEDKLQSWLAAYAEPKQSCRVGIIMAGNIPLVGFFDLMCVLLSGHTALVKPSSKDAVLMNYIIGQLREICPTIPIEYYTDDKPLDRVIATGGDAAAAHFRAHYADVPALIRGSRHSIAILSGKEAPEQMEGLCRDIYTYSGLGCRNVSLMFIPQGWSGEIPRPKAMVEMKRGNYMCDKAMLTMMGVAFEDLGGALAVNSCSFPEALSRVHYTYYNDLQEVEEWLREHDEELQCVVTNVVNHPRKVDFGRAQHPTLWDYADGVDVMEFLII